MHFSLFSRKSNQKHQIYLSLDIGTEFVKVIIFSIDNGNIKVEGVGKVRQPVSAVKNGQVTNINSVMDSSRSAIEMAMNGIRAFPASEVVIGIAGELVKSVSVVANYNRDNPEEKITVNELIRVFDNVKPASFEEAKKIFEESTGNTNPQIKLINASIVDSYIDNYKVENVIGFPGSKARINIYTTYAPLVHVGALENIAKQLKLKPVLIPAQPFAVARSVKGAREEGFEAIIIDVGGGTTDIAVVKKGGVVDTHMIAFGGRVFTKRIAQELHVDYEKAEQLKIEYSNKSLDRATSNIIKKAISRDIYMWICGVELALREFKNTKVFPMTVLLCGGGSLLPEIKDALIEHHWTELPFERIPKVIFLECENIDRIVDENSLAKGIDMVTPLSLARLMLDLKNNLELING